MKRAIFLQVASIGLGLVASLLGCSDRLEGPTIEESYPAIAIASDSTGDFLGYYMPDPDVTVYMFGSRGYDDTVDTLRQVIMAPTAGDTITVDCDDLQRVIGVSSSHGEDLYIQYLNGGLGHVTLTSADGDSSTSWIIDPSGVPVESAVPAIAMDIQNDHQEEGVSGSRQDPFAMTLHLTCRGQPYPVRRVRGKFVLDTIARPFFAVSIRRLRDGATSADYRVSVPVIARLVSAAERDAVCEALLPALCRLSQQLDGDGGGSIIGRAFIETACRKSGYGWLMCKAVATMINRIIPKCDIPCQFVRRITHVETSGLTANNGVLYITALSGGVSTTRSYSVAFSNVPQTLNFDVLQGEFHGLPEVNTEFLTGAGICRIRVYGALPCAQEGEIVGISIWRPSVGRAEDQLEMHARAPVGLGDGKFSAVLGPLVACEKYRIAVQPVLEEADPQTFDFDMPARCPGGDCVTVRQITPPDVGGLRLRFPEVRYCYSTKGLYMATFGYCDDRNVIDSNVAGVVTVHWNGSEPEGGWNATIGCQADGVPSVYLRVAGSETVKFYDDSARSWRRVGIAGTVLITLVTNPGVGAVFECAFAATPGQEHAGLAKEGTIFTVALPADAVSLRFD